MQRLENEKKLIGVFLSGHPMDAYRLPAIQKGFQKLRMEMLSISVELLKILKFDREN